MTSLPANIRATHHLRSRAHFLARYKSTNVLHSFMHSPIYSLVLIFTWYMPPLVTRGRRRSEPSRKLHLSFSQSGKLFNHS